MERQIKFRAWDNKEKKWLMGYELPNLGGFSLFGECMLFEEWSHILDTFLFERKGYKHEDLKVMQYTGLKDKNGKEIYEGDVVNIDGLPVKVEWYNGAWTVEYFTSPKRSYLSTFDENDVEIIGNIYENKDFTQMKNTQPFITTDLEMIDQYWQEHDGDHFYKDELKEVVKEILSLHKERLIKEVSDLDVSTMTYGAFRRKVLEILK